MHSVACIFVVWDSSKNIASALCPLGSELPLKKGIKGADVIIDAGARLSPAADTVLLLEVMYSSRSAPTQNFTELYHNCDFPTFHPNCNN